MGSDPLLEHLAGLCRREPTRAKWVIVANHAVGLTLADRLAREHGTWVNVRFVTPLDLATRMAAPFLVEKKITPSEETLGPALVMRLLLRLPEAGGYFRPMAHHTSMAEALWRAIRELRYAAIDAPALIATPFSGIADKQAELAALVTAYERHLEVASLADMPAVFQEALKHLDWCAIESEDVVLRCPNLTRSPVVGRFLDALPGQAAIAALPPPFSGPGAKAGGAAIAIFHAGGRDAEIDEILRRIASSGLPLDQVEVAVASGVSPSLVWEKAMRLEWPVTLAGGLPAAVSRAGRLLLRFCDWIDSGFDAAFLRRLLHAGDLASDAIGPDVTPGQAARLMLKAKAAWGRGTYGPSLTARAEDYEHRAQDPEASDADREWNARKATQTRALVGWVAEVLGRIPEPDAAQHSTVLLSDVVNAAAWFLESHAGQASALDRMGRTALVEALGDLRQLDDYRCDVSTALRFIRERVESLVIGRDRPRPGHLHVSPLRDAGHDGRPLVFFAGLEEGAIFSSAVEDPVLLDIERGAFSPPLPTSLDRHSDEVAQVLARIAAVCSSARQACFSFSCRDTRDFRETFPSWIVLQAYRLQQSNPSLTYEDLAASLGEPVSSVAAAADAALTDGGWWLSHRHQPMAADVILRTCPSLARGRDAEAARASDIFTEYDGLVPEAGQALDPSRTQKPVSASVLESAAKCPMRFFMRSGLGVRPIEEGKPDEDGWLAPTTRGTELHELFARVMRLARKEERAPHLAKDGARLRAWGRERLAQLKAEMPPSSDEVFSRESRAFLEDLESFLVAECEGRHGNGIGFEVSFGFEIKPGNEEGLARSAPLEVNIGDGRKLVLHGWIDRINKLAPHEYEVADYKSSYWADDWQGLYDGGRRLQHAIYGAAAARALAEIDPKARVVRGTYLFPTVNGHGLKKAIPAPSAATFRALLRRIADVIGSGVFAPADAEGDCQWCDYKGACRVETIGATKMLANTDNTRLAPYDALRKHHE